MNVTVTPRDYSLVGRDSKRALENGLAAARWYQAPITRKDLKELMKRKDGPALRDTAIWFAALVLFGGLGYYFWGSWLRGAVLSRSMASLYGSSSDSRWHECGHGTAFKTRWMNDVVYHIACFMILREPTIWRWSHTRHHTDTIIVGRDPEIVAKRPPDIVAMLLNVFALKIRLRRASQDRVCMRPGRLTAEEVTFVPGNGARQGLSRRAHLCRDRSRCVDRRLPRERSILPAMLVGLPTFYGAWLAFYFGVTQHVGLAEDVLDHRLNSRTVYMNPIFRFLYWNMNYHVEHHMFPMVPYHALPKLHAAIKADCPPPYPSTIAAYREILLTIARQLRDPSTSCIANCRPPRSAPASVGISASGLVTA